MQKACEPVHVQLNLDDSMVAVINRTYIAQKGLKIEAEVYSVVGKRIHRQEEQIDIGSPDRG